MSSKSHYKLPLVVILLSAVIALVVLASCKQPARDCTDFKTGKFKFESVRSNNNMLDCGNLQSRPTLGLMVSLALQLQMSYLCFASS